MNQQSACYPASQASQAPECLVLCPGAPGESAHPLLSAQYTFGEKLMGNVSLEEDGILPMGERGGENPTYSLEK